MHRTTAKTGSTFPLGIRQEKPENSISIIVGLLNKHCWGLYSPLSSIVLEPSVKQLQGAHRKDNLKPSSIAVDRCSCQPTYCIHKAIGRKPAQQTLHHGERRPLPTSWEGMSNREVVAYLHTAADSVEMSKKQFQVPLWLEDLHKADTFSMFSSLAMQILGYYASLFKSFSDTSPCKKACPGTTHTLSPLQHYRLTSSYIIDEHPDGTLFFRFSYEDWK